MKSPYTARKSSPCSLQPEKAHANKEDPVEPNKQIKRRKTADVKERQGGGPEGANLDWVIKEGHGQDLNETSKSD